MRLNQINIEWLISDLLSSNPIKGIVNLVLDIDGMLNDGTVDMARSAGKTIFILNLDVLTIMKRKGICMNWGSMND